MQSKVSMVALQRQSFRVMAQLRNREPSFLSTPMVKVQDAVRAKKQPNTVF